MKDYFDLWFLLAEDSLDVAELRHAIRTTFRRRALAVPQETPIGLSDDFANDAAKQAQWSAFQRKNRLEAPSLPEVVELLRREFDTLGVGTTD